MIFERLREDIKSFKARDPAARSALEIILCYPGFHALLIYRLSHWLWGLKLHLPARFISHVGKILTGIEIHPGAQIGRRSNRPGTLDPAPPLKSAWHLRSGHLRSGSTLDPAP